MKLLTILLFFVITQSCFSQFKLIKLDKNTVPKNIQYTGNIVQAYRWEDSIGSNIVLLTVTDRTKNKNIPDGNFVDKALSAYHYQISGDSVKLSWRINDYVKECDVDIFLYFVAKAFAVTDLNKDGIAEVWIMYKVSCQGDVSPVPMKIIMYQGNKKYAVRGTTRVQVSLNEYMGGEYTFDEAFKNAPSEFRQYADRLWKQNKTETWTQ